jgi:hypothetical protein
MKAFIKSIVSHRPDRKTWYFSKSIGNNTSFYLEKLQPAAPFSHQQLDENCTPT